MPDNTALYYWLMPFPFEASLPSVEMPFMLEMLDEIVLYLQKAKNKKGVDKL